ncbi:hypothetical protein [Lonepinella sp. BR2271]|uniref:hypothetical protein n=1 Tax=Lonepinella sp. BR2271 TaxID=3434550 RepID=UPI003F6DA8D2
MKTKIKHLLAAGLVALTLTACNEESKDYSGSYVNEDTIITFSKLGNNEYKMNFKSDFVDVNNSGYVKDNKFYHSNNSVMGTFNNNTYEVLNGKTYTKQ